MNNCLLLIRRGYIWALNLFKMKENNAIYAKNFLNTFFDGQFSVLNKYCENKEAIPVSGYPVGDFFHITNPSPDCFEFECLGWKFRIKKELFPFDGMGHLKTYEIVENHEDYGKTKLEVLSYMTIVKTVANEKPRFLKPMGEKKQNSGYLAYAQPGQITEFSTEYISRLLEVLSIKYQAPPKISK